MPNSMRNNRTATKANSTVVAPARRRPPGRPVWWWWMRMGSASGGPAGQGGVDGERVVHEALPVRLGRQGLDVDQGQAGPPDVVVRDTHPDPEPLVLHPGVRVGLAGRRGGPAGHGRLDELELDGQAGQVGDAGRLQVGPDGPV